MSEININRGNIFRNTQIGDGPVMNIYELDQSSDTAPYMTKEDWDELKTFILNEGREKGVSDKDAIDIMVCAQSQDEQGLKDALASDTKNFLLSVLGGVASTGLIAALKKLFGMQ